MITHIKSQLQTMTKNRRYSPEFRLEAAQLVVDQGYTLKAACEAMGVGKSTMEYWVRRLRTERSGKAPQKGEALTPEQREIQFRSQPLQDAIVIDIRLVRQCLRKVMQLLPVRQVRTYNCSLSEWTIMISKTIGALARILATSKESLLV